MIDKDSSEGKAPGEGGDDLGRLRELFEKSPVALTLADARLPDMPLVVANAAFLDLTGYDRDEVMGRNCRFLQADLPNDDARTEVHAVIARGGQGQIVFRNRTKSGEDFDNLLFLQGLDDRSGTPRYFLGSQFLLERSVTERRIERGGWRGTSGRWTWRQSWERWPIRVRSMDIPVSSNAAFRRRMNTNGRRRGCTHWLPTVRRAALILCWSR